MINLSTLATLILNNSNEGTYKNLSSFGELFIEIIWTGGS